MLIIYAQKPYYLYVSRILSGFVASSIMISLTIFVSEISHDKWVTMTIRGLSHSSSYENNNKYEFICSIRGTLNSAVDPFLNSGVVFAMLLGKRFDYIDQAKFHLILPIIFMIFFVWVPESPQHLINMRKEKVSIRFNVSAHTIYSFIEGIFRPRINRINSSKALNWRNCQ